MKYKVTGPDGRVYQGTAPDDATEADIMAYVQSQVKPTMGPTINGQHSVTGLKQPDPAPEGTFEDLLAKFKGVTPQSVDAAMLRGSDTALAGMGKAFTDIGRGVEQRYRDLRPPDDKSAALQAEIVESRKLDAPLMATPQGMTGNLLGYVGAGALLPGAGTVAGSTLVGSALGAATPTVEGESAAGNTLLGAGSALLGHAVTGVGSRVLNPNTPPQARMLMDEGVTLTPGQINAQGGFVGRALKATEDKLTSVPLIGDAITQARGRGLHQFNQAALNRVTRPLGRKVTDVGHNGLQQAHQIIRDAYDDVLPKITLKIDPVLGRELAGLNRLTANLNPDLQQQFNNTIQNEVLSKFAAGPKGATMAGQIFKNADTELGRLARTYRSSQVGSERELGNALSLAQRIFRNAVTRTNPPEAATLRRANAAFAQLLRVEKAGGGMGAHESIFTPAQLKNAVSRLDSSYRKRAFLHGQAPMQDLAEAGQAVLPSKIPDSGTAGRAAIGLLGLGGLYGGGQLAGDESGMTQGLALAGLLGAGLYSRPGVAAMQGLMAPGRNTREAGEAIRRLIPYAASATPAFNLQAK